jgi:hypothetical protein
LEVAIVAFAIAAESITANTMTSCAVKRFINPPWVEDFLFGCVAFHVKQSRTFASTVLSKLRVSWQFLYRGTFNPHF